MHVRGSSSAVEYAKKSFALDPMDVANFAEADSKEIPLLGARACVFLGCSSPARPPNTHAPACCLHTGLPKGKDWVLHGPENDRTLGMRNWLGYNAARRTGRYASRTQYFELFLETVRAFCLRVCRSTCGTPRSQRTHLSSAVLQSAGLGWAVCHVLCAGPRAQPVHGQLSGRLSAAGKGVARQAPRQRGKVRGIGRPLRCLCVV